MSTDLALTTTPTQLRKLLRVIFLALGFGQFFFLVIMLVVGFTPPDGGDTRPISVSAIPFGWILLFLILTAYPLAFWAFYKMEQKALAAPTQPEQLDLYKQAAIVRAAIMEGVFLFSGVAYLVTRGSLILYASILLVFVNIVTLMATLRIQEFVGKAEGGTRGANPRNIPFSGIALDPVISMHPIERSC